MSKFYVETEALKSAASKLEGKVGDYNAQVQRLYLEVQSLLVEWDGTSSNTFNNQLEGFRNDFQAVADAVLAYVEFLKQAAEAYEQKEEALTQGASSLNAGN